MEGKLFQSSKIKEIKGEIWIVPPHKEQRTAMQVKCGMRWREAGAVIAIDFEMGSFLFRL